jgi:xanthine dehydrogenase YagS FAD-binding subunit
MKVEAKHSTDCERSVQPFAYVRIDDPNAAIRHAEADAGRAHFLAGGTTLLDLMKLDVQSPRQVIDINHLPLAQIEVTDRGARIGALVTNTDMAYHADIRKRYPVLSEAILSGATPQLRNMATLGGNLMQRTRCSYFRDATWACNKREPGSGCSALEGYNRSHAVLGTSDKCIATHPSDMCVALAALDTVVVTQTAKQERRIPFADFHVAYGDDPAKETNLKAGELITAVELPNTPFFARSHYVKVRDRAAFEFALASAAVAIDIEGGRIRAARVAIGGVATKPWRSVEAERLLVGAPADEATYKAAATAALAGAKPQKFNAFKVELARRTLVRALSELGATP